MRISQNIFWSYSTTTYPPKTSEIHPIFLPPWTCGVFLLLCLELTYQVHFILAICTWVWGKSTGELVNENGAIILEKTHSFFPKCYQQFIINIEDWKFLVFYSKTLTGLILCRQPWLLWIHEYRDLLCTEDAVLLQSTSWFTS